MENRYLYRGKRSDNGEWVEWNMLTGIPHDVHILKDTICQCTGYEGIYERDIIRYDYEEYVIKWSDDSLSWEAISLETDVSVPLGELNPDYMVVIGNEIDNLELLEV